MIEYIPNSQIIHLSVYLVYCLEVITSVCLSMISRVDLERKIKVMDDFQLRIRGE